MTIDSISTTHFCSHLAKNPASWRIGWLIAGWILFSGNVRFAVSQEPATPFQAFVQQQARELRATDRIPATNDEWQQRREFLRSDLLRAWGEFPQQACDLEPRQLGGFQRTGYRVERLILQTLPGVWMTANAYVPDQPGKRPAILHVHGHWAGAKQDPVVQSRCIGCAKLGFFVLCVDAFGAGERGVGQKLGEYHGEMTAATLLPVGRPLSGLQVYENMRAVDYLLTRPEVDPDGIGITGASGGGNQAMYAGAFDERFRCVVPTCSVGTYQAYLGAACCLCEVIPGGLRFTEEGDILGMAANRGLMVTSATMDAPQFSVQKAKTSFARAEAISQLNSTTGPRHTIVEAPHAYNQQMREAMYGWMMQHLAGRGDGSPIPEPLIETEDPELLRCFAEGDRPKEFVTIPRFAEREANDLSRSHAISSDRVASETARHEKRRALTELLGGMPQPAGLRLQALNDPDGASQTLVFDSESQLSMVARRDLPEKSGRLALMLDIDDGAEKAWSGELANQLRETGWSVIAPELRATGRQADPRDKIGSAPDHNTAEWSLWIGRPLLGQWVWDVHRTLDAVAERDGSLPHEIMAIGRGSSGIVALCAAALDERITRVKTIDVMVTYVTDSPYRGVRLGLMVPGILRDFGDVADVAALVAPRGVTIQGGVNGIQSKLDVSTIRKHFSNASRSFERLGVPGMLVFEESR